MKLRGWLIPRPDILLAAVVLILLFGGISFYQLGIQLIPDIHRPQISVSTNWRSAAPEEVEAFIIEPQENILKTIPNVIEVSSNSAQGGGSVNLTFPLGADMSKAYLDVVNAVNQVPRLPDDADEPVIRQGAPLTAATLMLYPNDPASEFSIRRVQNSIDNTVVPALRKIPGITRVDISGSERPEELIIGFDPHRLAALNIQIDDITRTLANANNRSGGVVELGRRQYTIRYLGQYDLHSITNLVIRMDSGSVIRIGDIANVSIQPAKRRNFIFRSGSAAYYLRIEQASGSNSLDILDSINSVITTLNEGQLKAEGLTLEMSYDASVHIRRAIQLVQNNLGIGVLLALLILWLFIGNLRAVLIISFTIPIALLCSFIALKVFGRSLNVTSIAGLAFSVGLVLDAAIIAVENIVRLRQQGIELGKAVVSGIQQVAGALTASTITSIAIFIPILFMQGVEGQLFYDLSLTLIVAVFSSLISALLVLPVATKWILKEAEEQTRLVNFWQWIVNKTLWLTNHPSKRLSWIALLLLIPVIASMFLLPKADLLPGAKADALRTIIINATGQNTTYLEQEVGKPIIERLAPYLEGKQPMIKGYNLFSFDPGWLMLVVYPVDPKQNEDILALLKTEITQGFPGIRAFASQDSMFRLNNNNRTIDVDIQGPDLQVLAQVAERASGAIKKVMPKASIRQLPRTVTSEPTLAFTPIEHRIVESGLDSRQIGNLIRAYTSGLFVGEYFNGDERLDVILRQKNEFSTPESLMATPIATPLAGIQTLDNLTNMYRKVGPAELSRIDGQRTISLQVSPEPDLPLQSAIDKIQHELAPLVTQYDPQQLTIKYRGSADSLEKALNTMLFNFLFAILILFLIVSVLFSSVLDSIVVLFSLPLAVFGGFFAFWILNQFVFQTFDLLTMIGLIILLGLVINNAILLVAQIRLMQQEVKDKTEAFKLAISQRVRAIYMSTITSIVGMLPLMLVPGTGAEIYRGLATVIVGGMAINLIFVPILITSLLHFRDDTSFIGLFSYKNKFAFHRS